MAARTFSELMLVVPLALAACSDQDIAPSVQPETVISAKQPDDSASASASSAPARAVDADYAKLLAEIVDDGLVHYELLGQPQRTALLHSIVKQYASAPLPDNSNERLALRINAYNANVLAMAFHHSRQPGFTTIKEVSGFFDSLPVVVCGSATTLNRLEDEIRAAGDPRIHAAVVCGARSCPPLRPEPYTAQSLDQQLTDQSRLWIEDNRLNKVDLRTRSLALSQIFEWYAADFEVEPYQGVIGFVRKFSRPRGHIRDYLNNQRDQRVTFLPYDWRLNQALVVDAQEEPKDQP